MDAGLAAHGHGSPIAAGPRSRTGARVCRATARHRTKGARAFGYLALLQVTRRKGETNRSRNRRNGYVHQQESHRRSGRHREQARLPQYEPGASGEYPSAMKPPSPAGQLPQFDPGPEHPQKSPLTITGSAGFFTTRLLNYKAISLAALAFGAAFSASAGAAAGAAIWPITGGGVSCNTLAV